MDFYAVSTLIWASNYLDKSEKKIFYADMVMEVTDLLGEWWDDLKRNGPLFRYYPEATKTWLIVKPARHPLLEQQRCYKLFYQQQSRGMEKRHCNSCKDS